MEFSYSDYQNSINRNTNSKFAKVGFFKLADGQKALVRFNVHSIDDLKFNTVHIANFGTRYQGLPGFSGVTCLNTLGSTNNTCPFCAAAATGHKVVGIAKKKVYTEALVSYQDTATGSWTPAQPVVWERPAGFAKEIATKLQNLGDLTQILVIVTRIGGGQDTTYSIDYAMPTIFKPEMIPADFSAFDNFDISKHSYWMKTTDELNDYLATGSFPEIVKANTTPTTQAQQPAYTAPASVNNNVTYTPAPAQFTQAAPVQNVQTPAQAQQVPFDGPYTQTPVAPAAPVQAPTKVVPSEDKPANTGRNFSGFNF